MKNYYVYILASKRNGTLYIGMTNSITRRTHEHKTEFYDGFTKRYSVKRLVYYERHPSPASALKRERQMKKWNRAWKLRLIEEMNPEWEDLALEWMEGD
ncbi:MAG: GIY-YIG nuclease family protein [Flavobacteriales bacterium]|nr:GIY-YIG nuclease family protein [Flavobacteriales bacterium]